jgi:SAM-dependent methyltransferase
MTNSKQIGFPNLHGIEQKIKILENFLINQEFQKTDYYKKWFKDFNRIYGTKLTNLRLYILSAILYFMGYIFIFKFVRNKDKNLIIKEIDIDLLKETPVDLERDYYNQKSLTIEYYDQFLSIFPKESMKSLTEILLDLSQFTFNSDIAPEFYFDYLIQNFLSPLIRHKSGEFYTPPFLVKEMVKKSYKFGEKVLDPSCGSGNFLIEIAKKILSTNRTKNEKERAINNIFGYDINPLSIFFSKLSFLYLLNQKLINFKLNLYVLDSLFENDKNLKSKFDLVIGNPPWYTLSDIESLEYQNQVKLLAEELEIKPGAKNILNIEISALFFYKARKDFMKNKAKIFFVMTRGVITGSHASRFRNFKGFSDMKIWLFNKKIMRIFNIEFICLYARKSEKINSHSKPEIPAYRFSFSENLDRLEYFDDIRLMKENSIKLVPYSVEKKAGKLLTKKLIPIEQKEKLLPIHKSYYKNLFHKGADLNPRNLIFITYEIENNELVKINPDDRVLKRAKTPWNKKEFKNELVERNYIFKVVKSTELVKFLIYDYYNVFLPLEKEDLAFDFTILGKHAKRFYDKINNIYLHKKKSTTKNLSLMDNLNRWSKLRNLRQLSKIKVVYNNSGSILNAAVIEGDFLVTGDLSFLDTENLNEAYYICAILNSPLMTKQIRIKKSSRHIFKIPFESPIKKYNESLKSHRELAKLAREGHLISKQTIDNLKKQKNNLPSKIIIQKKNRANLKHILNHIDNILEKEFSN